MPRRSLPRAAGWNSRSPHHRAQSAPSSNPIASNGSARTSRSPLHPLASPPGEVRHEHVVTEMHLGLVQEDPAARPALAPAKGSKASVLEASRPQNLPPTPLSGPPWPSMDLPGRLRSTTLGDLLGALHRAGSTGTVELTEDQGRLHRVYLAQGLVTAVELDGATPSLAEILRGDRA